MDQNTTVIGYKISKWVTFILLILQIFINQLLSPIILCFTSICYIRNPKNRRMFLISLVQIAVMACFYLIVKSDIYDESIILVKMLASTMVFIFYSIFLLNDRFVYVGNFKIKSVDSSVAINSRPYSSVLAPNILCALFFIINSEMLVLPFVVIFYLIFIKGLASFLAKYQASKRMLAQSFVTILAPSLLMRFSMSVSKGYLETEPFISFLASLLHIKNINIPIGYSETTSLIFFFGILWTAASILLINMVISKDDIDDNKERLIFWGISIVYLLFIAIDLSPLLGLFL